MGVQARIVLYAPDSSTAETAALAAFDRVAALDEIMSDYRVDSELTELTRRAGMGPIPVSDDLFRILDMSQRLARQSNGAFDVTVSPFVRLWRQARRSGILPHPDSLEAASRLVGWRKLRLDQCARTATLEERGMKLDLGGIAKGYAADEAVEALRRNGVQSALVEFGGDVVVSEAPPGEEGWKITAVLADGREVTLSNAAISTSGDTEQFVEIGGKRYSHIVDPRTGMGVTARTAVTVIAPSGVLSDAIATTLSVTGENGLKMIASEYPAVKAYVRYLGT